jgi:DNA processing protein
MKREGGLLRVLERVPTDPRELSEEDREAAFWAAFANVRHVGPARIARLLSRFETLSEAWSAPLESLRLVLEPRALSELASARRVTEPERQLEDLRLRGIRILHAEHPEYPSLLVEASGRPTVLYIRGRLTPEDNRSVGIVGTRRSTVYGKGVTERISQDLAAAGVTVVSGLARGIDAVAHHVALESGGRTVAVLGSGVDVIYPSEHRRLVDRILENGAVISEQPPGAKPDAPNFPARNRIISGMSLGVVVIEAPARSGALITANFAADQGREVFVVPGNVGNATSEGTNQLLRDGARIVRDGADILADLGIDGSGPAQLTLQLPATPEEARVLRCLGSEPVHIDEIAELAGLPGREVAEALLMMELKGLARNCGAQYYVHK